MTFVMIVVFVIGNSMVTTQVGTKTYTTADECTKAAAMAKFSNPNTTITAVAWCAPQ